MLGDLLFYCIHLLSSLGMCTTHARMCLLLQYFISAVSTTLRLASTTCLCVKGSNSTYAR